MTHTIVAKNSAGGVPDLLGLLTSSGYNLIGKTSGPAGYAPTDILDVDPLLGPLTDNGGPTLTHALLPGSPALDAGDPNIVDPPEWDQRGPGYPRIVNGTIDIGAFEVQATFSPSHSSQSPFVPTRLPEQEAWRRTDDGPASPDALVVAAASAASVHDDFTAIKLRFVHPRRMGPEQLSLDWLGLGC